MTKKKTTPRSGEDKIATEWHTMTMAAIAALTIRFSQGFGLPTESSELLIPVPDITEAMQRSFSMAFTEDKSALILTVGPATESDPDTSDQTLQEDRQD